MRVIAGEARSLPLKTPEGQDTRPTTDRIKETLFNILQGDIPGSIFVDLCSGSGGIGIEAISRGAKRAYFAENAVKAAKCIQDNLSFTKFTDRAVPRKRSGRDFYGSPLSGGIGGAGSFRAFPCFLCDGGYAYYYRSGAE